MALCFEQRRSRRLLVIPPLFDEANKFRHQLSEVMRRLDEGGVDCFLPDLPGCNESMAPLHAQTLAGWRQAVGAAAAHFGAAHVLAVRSGCWLVPDDVPAALYAPAKPAQVLRNMLRARVLAAKEAGHPETAEALLDDARSNGIVLAGWQLGAELVGELETAVYDPSPRHRVVEQAELGGRPLWLRAENDFDAAQAETLAAIVMAEMADR
ncbi:hypothetical protein [Qipengyuania citrea]|nr:hypothetical protein [Qipengyuania citrea]